MSNHLAIAAVTETLRVTLEKHLDDVVTGAKATVGRPPEPADNNADLKGVNLYLYQVTPNPAWRNEDLPTRSERAQLVRRPRAALDLHYLLTFHGDDNIYEPQRILGDVVRKLHALPILTRNAVAAAVAGIPQLNASDLANDVDVVRVTPAPLSLEELSKLWSVFLQTKYVLSAVYQASVVLIETSDSTSPTLPVAAYRLKVVPSLGPVIVRLASKGPGAGDPIVTGAPLLLDHTLFIEGNGLRGEQTLVRIGNSILTPPVANVTSERITIPLASLPPAEKRAGVKLVQVIHKIDFGTAADPHRAFESNAMPFMLAPKITAQSATATAVTVTVDPQIFAGQRLVLLLNETPAPAAPHPPPDPPVFAYAFPQVVATTGAAVNVAIDKAVPPVNRPRSYLLRVQVDGAQSPIEIETNPLSPNFGLLKDEPKVAIP